MDDARFQATVLVRYHTQPMAFGAFQHKGLPGTKPLGRGRVPDDVELRPRFLRLSGESRTGPPFAMELARSSTRLRSIDRRWSATVFWLQCEGADVGLHVPRRNAKETERLLLDYLKP